jgi:hypothetical protein
VDDAAEDIATIPVRATMMPPTTRLVGIRRGGFAGFAASSTSSALLISASDMSVGADMIDFLKNT